MAHEEAPKQTLKVTSPLNLYNDTSLFYLNETFSDIQIVLTDKKVPAHKVVLAARCKFFEILLLKDPKQSELRLQGVSSNVFVKILEFIYTGAVTLVPSDQDLTFNIINLSNEYSLTTLKKAIVDQLKSDVSKTTVRTLMNQATLYKLEELSEACLSFIDNYVADFLENDFFNSFAQRSLVKVLQRDAFPVSEIDIFRIVEKWCKMNKDVEGLVAGCLRTSLFTKNEILNVVGPSKLVDSFELLQVVARIENNTLKKTSRASPTSGQKFYQGTESVRKASHSIGDQKGIILDLRSISDWNHIWMRLEDGSQNSYSYYIETSSDLDTWNRIIDYTQYRCRLWQILYFQKQKFRYIKIVGTFATPGSDFVVDRIEVFLQDSVPRLSNGIIRSDTNVVTPELGAIVIEGLDRLYLMDGKTTTSCDHRLGRGHIVIQLGQPYEVSSLRMLLAEWRGSPYRYFVETSTNSTDWTVAVDMRNTNCKGMQFHNFTKRVVLFIRITGTYSDDHLFRCCKFECPA